MFDGALLPDPKVVVAAIAVPPGVVEAKAELAELIETHARTAEAGRALRRLPTARGAANPHEARAQQLAGEANSLLPLIAVKAQRLAALRGPYLRGVDERLDGLRAAAMKALQRLMDPGMVNGKFNSARLDSADLARVTELLRYLDGVENERRLTGSENWLVPLVVNGEEINWRVVVARVIRFAR